jgi:hypothetical protein
MKDKLSEKARKEFIKKVIVALGKTYVDKTLEVPIKKLVKTLKGLSSEKEIKAAILSFFNIQALTIEKQAYVLITLIQVYDLQLVSKIHNKVLHDFANKNRFVDIMFH